MIEGKLKEVKPTYRQREGLNFSSIKTFEDKGVGIFFKEFMVGDKKDVSTNAVLIGNMVDDIILTYGGDFEAFQQNFDYRYAKFDGVKSSAQAFVLADYIFESMMEVELGVKTVENASKLFEACFSEAFNKIQAEGKYKGKTPEQALQDFEKVARGYFDQKISNIGKMVVDLDMINVAQSVANQLLQDEFTASLLKGERDRKMWMPKVQVEFGLFGVVCKAELDAIEIDHHKKSITPYDLKCVYDNEEFPYSYIRNRYYLQQAFYTQALHVWKAENEMEDYTINPFKFIVADTSANKRRPLVYELSEEDVEKGNVGFMLRGTQYRGVIELVKEIKWHMENDVWNCSKEAFEKQGLITLSINYDRN